MRRAAGVLLSVLWVAMWLTAADAGAHDATIAGRSDPGSTDVGGTTVDPVDAVGLVRSAGGNGSGWIARPDTVVTNLHVARAGSGDIYVEFPDGTLVECFTAVGRREMDLAVLRCDTGDRPSLPIDTSLPEPDTPAVVVGYPGAKGPVTTTGFFAADRPVVRGISTLRFTAVIAPGSSGSPVMDEMGRVRAVATFGGDGGLGVAIGELQPLLDSAERIPSTKQAAEWRLRLRRSAMVAAVGLPVGFLFARRRGRQRPGVSALRWTIVLVLFTLGATQVQFMMSGAAHLI